MTGNCVPKLPLVAQVALPLQRGLKRRCRHETTLTHHVLLHGPCQPEAVLTAMENFVSWEALRLSWDAPGQIDSHLFQDLEQEAMLFVHRLLLRDPEIRIRKLEQHTLLAMRSALRRGRSVFRADPGSRQRHYRRVTLIQVEPGEVCTTSLSFARKYDLLQKCRGPGMRG